MRKINVVVVKRETYIKVFGDYNTLKRLARTAAKKNNKELIDFIDWDGNHKYSPNGIKVLTIPSKSSYIDEMSLSDISEYDINDLTNIKDKFIPYEIPFKRALYKSKVSIETFEKYRDWKKQ